ncbi:MAG TPA: TolC family protein [Bryobacteraceae bacterium]|jgi:outer membrane protein|nr:TolC family protein [Bryobacteraceae bacterium]
MKFFTICSTAVLLAAVPCLPQKLVDAGSPEVTIEGRKRLPVIQPLISPFNAQRRYVSPAKLSNSPRLQQLVRAGNLYLNVDDVIALTLENNLDIAIQRYGSFLAQEVLRRTQSGNAPRAFNVPIYNAPSSVSTAGITAASVTLAGGGGGVNSGGGLVATIGATPVQLDPVFTASAQFAHSTIPETLTIVSLVPYLVSSTQQFSFAYTQSFTPGTTIQFDYQGSHSHVNSPANAVNPYIYGTLDFNITQNLLQGFGKAVNNRYIRIAKNNMKVNDLNFKEQVITTIAGVLNLYWDLVSFDDDLHNKQKALETAEQLLEDNKHEVELGQQPAIVVTQAEAQVSQAREDLLIAQTNVAQQEIVLKNMLSRNNSVDSWLDDVHIVPLDHIVIPEKEDLPPAAQLIDEALAARPEIQLSKINLESQKISTEGTRNNLLPTLTGFADINNQGLAGQPNALCPAGISFCVPLQAFVGGGGTVLGEIFRRNYPNYSAGISVSIPFRNRVAQGDYVDDLLTERQTELQYQKTINDVRVQVKNAIISLQQARARYENAVATRKLAEQTLEAEQMRFKFGESTIATVVQAQRDLITDQTQEIQTMANYTHAKIAFDEALGRTLEVNHVSIAEAVSGHVARESKLPEAPPADSAKPGWLR